MIGLCIVKCYASLMTSMLCSTLVATGGKATSSDKNSFSCGVVAESAGTNVSISNLEKKYPKRKKKETALTKHRKWLAELQNTKDRLENQYEEELLATQAKNEKVRNSKRVGDNVFVEIGQDII